MTFLNGILLAGMAAIAVPIAIHLFHKSRHRRVLWGAMHLLEQVLRTNHRQIKMEQWILLALRCAVPLLLALAMARPVFTGLRALMGNSPASIVILLDDSYSMAASSAGATAFGRSTAIARGVLGSLPRGSEAAVVLMGRAPRVLGSGSTFDIDGLVNRLDKLTATFGPADPAAALELAAGLLSGMHQSDREIVILSDLQSASWGDDQASVRSTMIDRLKALPIPPRIVLIPTGKAAPDNVSVDSVEYTQLMVGVGQPVPFRVNLRNHGASAVPNARVTLSIDGTQAEQTAMPLGPEETGQMLFTRTFPQPGSHILRVESDADALEPDNAYLVAIPVWKRVPVLLVNGDPGNGPMTGETDFLSLALQPLRSANTGIEDLVEARVIQPRELNTDAMKTMRVVVLANVPKLEDWQVKDLETYVKNGGGLLILPGNRVQTDWYNRTLVPRGLLPLPFATLRDSVRTDSQPAQILAQRFDHPALDFFNDPRNGSLAEVAAQTWYVFGAPGADPTSAPQPTAGNPPGQIRIPAKLDSGDALFVETATGQGLVMASAIPGDADWSNLPLRPAFVPLMQRLCTHLASTIYPPRNLAPGEPLLALLPAEAAGKRYVLTPPSGIPIDITAEKNESGARISYPNTWEPGVYTLAPPAGEQGNAAEPIHFAVNVDRTESGLQSLDAAKSKALAASLGAETALTYEDYRALDAIRRHGREFWIPILVLLLGALFLEQLLSARFASHRRVAKDGRVAV